MLPSMSIVSNFGSDEGKDVEADLYLSKSLLKPDVLDGWFGVVLFCELKYLFLSIC